MCLSLCVCMTYVCMHICMHLCVCMCVCSIFLTKSCDQASGFIYLCMYVCILSFSLNLVTEPPILLVHVISDFSITYLCFRTLLK